MKNFIPYGTYKFADKLVDSKIMSTRMQIAKQGYGLDKLIKDRWEFVKEAARN